MFGTKTQDEFTAALGRFTEGAQKIYADYVAKNFPTLTADPIECQWLQKRVRVVRKNGGVICFVDFETGDVLKAAGWKAPAKWARGNIYDADNGLKTFGPYGPAYLR